MVERVNYMKTYSFLLVLYAMCVIILISNTAECSNKRGGPPPAPVQIGTVEERQIGREITLIGDVVSFTEGDVHTEVEGLVAEFVVKEGDFIKEGDLIAHLDSSQLELLLEEKIEDKKRARVLLEKEQHEFKRFKMLSKSSSVSPQTLEKEQSEADSSRFQHRMLDAAVRLLEDRLKKKNIRAPYNGYVVEEYVHKGMWVQAGGKIVKMVQVEPIYVEVPFPQKDLMKIQLKDSVNIKIDALGSETLRGKITAIIALGDTSSRTFPVKIQLDNPDHRLKPGMLAYATFSIGKKRKALVVPKDAVVITPDQKKMLYLVNDGKAVPLPVTTGLASGHYIEVRGENLKKGLKVVTVGNERLRPGQAVQVQSPRSSDNNEHAVSEKLSHHTVK